MKNKFYTIAALIVLGITANAQVGIGTTTPAASSMLDITSTTKGLLMPRVTSAQRTAITTPAKGLEVFDITTNSPWYYNGTAWINGKQDITFIGSGTHTSVDADVPTTPYNVFIGQSAGSTTSDGNNVAIGLQALDAAVSTAGNNIAVGYRALGGPLAGVHNIGIGESTGRNLTTGNLNMAIGLNTLINATTGVNNVALGGGALSGVTTGSNNIGIGYLAGTNNGTTIAAGSRNIAIGFGAYLPTSTGDDQLSIGNSIFGTSVGGTTSVAKIGINTTAPQGALHVVRDITTYPVTGESAQLIAGGQTDQGQKLLLGYNTTEDKGYIQAVHSGQNWKDLMIQPIFGNVGIGLSSGSPSSLLHVNGVITATKIQGPSDSRFKKNIKPIENALEKVMKLGGYTYDWKDASEFPNQTLGKGHDMGVIAQEVEKQFPEAVSTNADGFKAVSYTELVPALIEAMKAQQVQIEELKAAVAKLKK
ncbi:tail fiber domain-containing protein [uncultured Flavobacterium sp.]|uniref:tail fiber domain-containing protein n=1 Tax=uncultured Flavobacterium sp. TaxID=165435 RepID=UPI0025F55557|nr:tail fiber domain-containing protein [uncultured Flavobacterium sp.]